MIYLHLITIFLIFFKVIHQFQISSQFFQTMDVRITFINLFQVKCHISALSATNPSHFNNLTTSTCSTTLLKNPTFAPNAEELSKNFPHYTTTRGYIQESDPLHARLVVMNNYSNNNIYGF